MQNPSFSSFPHRLALVLGSGGVRSIAALGIAERLAREGIRPDLVVGCSSGALFGAQVAQGMHGEEAVRLATTLWSAELTQQRRWRAYLQLIAPRLAGFGEGFALRDDRLIAERIGNAFGDTRLEHLPTPLRVAATDAATGQAVVLTQGRLVDALRASMAVPILFPSVRIGGRRLVDGVLSDPLPLAAAADARVVLSLGFFGGLPRRVDRVSRLVAQTSTTLINNLMQARTEAAQARGQKLIGLELDLERPVSLWETAAMPALFEAGWRAAEARLLDIVAALEAAQAPERELTFIE
ncbi:patatin-like phospholipase family protein [Hydrogenophaga sp. UC242_50]|uniref:patatin-like phospholipase family protein n=1 Tax=Hydrogenophaga sp. UC242_50 TaxID=3350169 RepID=UPI0036D27541